MARGGCEVRDGLWFPYGHRQDDYSALAMQERYDHQGGFIAKPDTPAEHRGHMAKCYEKVYDQHQRIGGKGATRSSPLILHTWILCLRKLSEPYRGQGVNWLCTKSPPCTKKGESAPKV